MRLLLGVLFVLLVLPIPGGSTVQRVYDCPAAYLTQMRGVDWLVEHCSPAKETHR